MSLSKTRKVLFVHDGPLYQDDHGKLYGLHYNNKLLERYTFLGETVSFMIRFAKVPELSARFSLIDHPAFKAIQFPDLKSLKSRILKKGEAEKITAAAVLAHDVIVARLPSSSGSVAVKYALKYNKPLLVEFVACGWDAYWNYSWKGKLVAPYFFLKQRLRMQKVPHVIYVTNTFLQGRYPTKGKHIGISDVELPRQDPSILEKRVAKIKSRNAESPLIMTTVAALDVPYKGQADVIRALYQLRKEGCIINYYLVGQGDATRLQTLIDALGLGDQVFIKGAIPHDRVFPFLDDVDIYIQPSKQEGLPRAVIEAMSRGCAVIGSDVGGIPELADPVFVFKKGNITDIVQKLRAINSDVLLTQAMFSVEVAARYSSETLEQKRRDFYQAFLSDNNL